MARKPPELSPSVLKRTGCMGIDCLRQFTFTRAPRRRPSKLSRWEFTARCASCPKVVVFSEAMMRNIQRVVKDIKFTHVTNNFDELFTKQ